MVRAAAKNHPSVAVVTSPARYARRARRGRGRRLRPRHPQAARRRGVPAHRRVRRRRRLLVRRRAYAPADDSALPGLPRRHLRAQERPALRREPAPARRALHRRQRRGLAEAEQLHGKEMSYNNYVDTDAARRAAYDHDEPCVAIIKHANPCGIAVGADVAEAHRKAHACDPLSAFGGVIAVNRPVTRGDGRAGRRDLHRGHRRAGLRGRRRRGPRPQEEHPRAALPRGARRRGRGQARSTAALLLQVTDRLQAEGDDPATWTLATGEALTSRRAGRPRLRLEGLPRGEVQRDPARQGRRLGRRRHGPGQPRRLREARGRAGRRGARARARTPPPTRSSRSPTAWRC